MVAAGLVVGGVPVPAVAAVVVPAPSGYHAGVAVSGGDFDGDGKFDLAVTGSQYFSTVPVARSNGDGSFRASNSVTADFSGWASSAGVKVVTDDFNGDGRADIALTGPAGWSSVPVAFSNGDGTFNVTNRVSAAMADFGDLAATAGAKVVSGDFNHDGRTDLALTGPLGWTTVPVAFSNGDGTFTVTNRSAVGFADLAWTRREGRVG
jgi:hypothetical protein